MNSIDINEEHEDKIWSRAIRHEMLQVSIEMSKLRGLSGTNHMSSLAAPYLHTARRPEERLTNSRCRLLLEANYKLCKPLDLPFYKDETDTIQAGVCKVESVSSQSNIQSVQLKPVTSKSRSRPIVRKELVTQKKKVSDSAIRDDSATTRKEHSKDARTQTLNEDQQVTEPPSSYYGEPIYKVLAVSSPGGSKRDKKLPKDVLKKNDSSRSVLLREIISDTENLQVGRRRVSPGLDVSRRKPIRMSDSLACATDTRGDFSLNAVQEIVDKPVRPDPHGKIVAARYAAALDVPKVNSDQIVPIYTERVSVEKNADNRAGSIGVARSESSTVLDNSDTYSFEDKLYSLQKELRDIRRLLQETQSKIPQGSSGTSDGSVSA